MFAEPERTDRLVRLYNDTYNNLRPRLFDGSHLRFPRHEPGHHGCNPHQKDAVWRGMSSGNTLLAHAVGAGKTFTMAATGMKMKQAGLAKKPMFVVPNHMLEQFAREFMQLYPNAQLLVATKDDLATRPPQAADRQDRQRRVGRHHRHPFQLRADRHVEATTRSGSSASRSGEYDQLLRDHAGGEHAAQHHQDHREAEGPPRGAAEGAGRRGQEG